MDHLQHDIQRCPRVAVYGTLKQGCHNHYWLEGATLLGSDRLTAFTLFAYSLYSNHKGLVEDIHPEPKAHGYTPKLGHRELCGRCGKEPVYMPLHLCELCWRSP